MKSILILVLIVVFVVMGSGIVWASEDSIDILIDTLISKQVITKEEAASIRARASVVAEKEARERQQSVSARQPIKLGGYIQERYTHVEQHGSNDSFEPKRARMVLSGDAADKVDFKLQVEFAGSRRGLTGAALTTNPDPTQTSLSTTPAYFSKPTLLDAMIGYELAKDSKISVGQFKIPFGLENLTPSYMLDTVNRSLVTETLVPGRDNGAQGRSIGVQLSGTTSGNAGYIPVLAYAVGVFDGAGINVPDDNDRKDLAARVVWKPGMHGLSMGMDRYQGSVGLDCATKLRTDAEMVYLAGPWSLKGEYIWGRDASIQKDGWYATLLRQITASTQFVLRYDRLDPNTSVADDSIGTWTFGLNRFLNKDGYTRWQLNYERRREQGPQVSNDQLLAQFQAGF